MKLGSFVEGVGVGVLVAYFFDPARGGRRRTQVRDRILSESARKRHAVQLMVRDFVNRSNGMKHRVMRRLNHASVSDEMIVERVRAELGRYVSHFHALEITCANSEITLSGPILASEIQDCIWHARMVPGVKHVVNCLQPQSSPERILEMRGPLTSMVDQRWTPATSLVMGGAGLLCAAYGARRQGIVGRALQVAGAGLIAKAFHDTEHRHDPSPRRRNGNSQNKRSTHDAISTEGNGVAIKS